MNDDERLKQTFERLRAQDARRAPTFDAVRRRAPRRVSAWAVAVPVGSLAVAAAAVLVVRLAGGPQEPTAMSSSPFAAPVSAPAPAPAAIAFDEAPLDFLLDVPGVHGAPDFDTSLLGRTSR